MGNPGSLLRDLYRARRFLFQIQNCALDRHLVRSPGAVARLQCFRLPGTAPAPLSVVGGCASRLLY